MELKNYRKQFQQSITSKNLPQIHRHIINAHIYSIESVQWRKYLVEIFVMLTDPQIQMPTFLRRSYIFNIFKMAIQNKIIQNDGKDSGVSIRRNVPFLKRVIQAMLMATTSRRNTDLDMQNSFHKFIQKILLNLTQFWQVNKQNLPQQKLKLLSQAYPIPNLKIIKAPNQPIVQFIYPDLLLWYQLCIHLQNCLQFRYMGQQQLLDYLGKLRSQVENIRQPVLKLIFIYTLVQQSIKVRSLFQQSESIAQKCVKIGILIMTQIRENVIVVFNIKETGVAYQQLSQNVFHCMIRFNVILITFILLQKLSNSTNSSIISSLIKQIKNSLALILPHCQKMIANILQKQKQNEEKYLKYQLQFYWIDYHIQKLANEIQKKLNKNRYDCEHQHLQDGMYINWDKINILMNCQYQNKCQKQFKYENLEKVLQIQIMRYRQKKAIKFSQGAKMSRLVSWSFYLLQNNPTLFQQILTKTLLPLQIVRFCLCLMTQYHLNHNILIHISLNFAQQVLIQYLTCPQSIKQTYQIQSIKHSIYIIRLSLVKTNQNYVCSLCGVFQLYQFCQYCGQACGKFIYPKQLQLNLHQKWEDWLKMFDYFLNNQKNRLREVIGGQLIQQLKLATYVNN